MGVQDEGVLDEGIQDEGVLDEGIQDEGIQWDWKEVGRKEQERTEEITDRGNVGGYHDGNPIYRAMCNVHYMVWYPYVQRRIMTHSKMKEEQLFTLTGLRNIRSKYL